MSLFGRLNITKAAANGGNQSFLVMLKGDVWQTLCKCPQWHQNHSGKVWCPKSGPGASGGTLGSWNEAKWKDVLGVSSFVHTKLVEFNIYLKAACFLTKLASGLGIPWYFFWGSQVVKGDFFASQHMVGTASVGGLSWGNSYWWFF